MNADNTDLDSLSGKVLNAVFEVSNALVVELKCAERLANEHTAQCLNYLRASGRPVCLLVNFQKPKVEWKRILSALPIRPKALAPRLEVGKIFCPVNSGTLP